MILNVFERNTSLNDIELIKWLSTSTTLQYFTSSSIAVQVTSGVSKYIAMPANARI